MPTRRAVLGSVGAGAATLAGCLGTEGESCPDGDIGSVEGSWSTRGGGPGHAGATTAGGFDSKPETRWCAGLEGRLTSLALADRTLYAVERVGDLGDRTFHLRSNAAGDGGERWRVNLPDEPIAEAAVADGGVHLAM
jgi:hypothetical protein